MRNYRPPAAAAGRAASAGVTITPPAVAADLAAVLAFETATFPSWTRWFRADHRDVPHSHELSPGPAFHRPGMISKLHSAHLLISAPGRAIAGWLPSVAEASAG